MMNKDDNSKISRDYQKILIVTDVNQVNRKPPLRERNAQRSDKENLKCESSKSDCLKEQKWRLSARSMKIRKTASEGGSSGGGCSTHDLLCSTPIISKRLARTASESTPSFANSSGDIDSLMNAMYNLNLSDSFSPFVASRQLRRSPPNVHLLKERDGVPSACFFNVPNAPAETIESSNSSLDICDGNSDELEFTTPSCSVYDSDSEDSNEYFSARSSLSPSKIDSEDLSDVNWLQDKIDLSPIYPEQRTFAFADVADETVVQESGDHEKTVIQTDSLESSKNLCEFSSCEPYKLEEKEQPFNHVKHDNYSCQDSILLKFDPLLSKEPAALNETKTMSCAAADIQCLHTRYESAENCPSNLPLCIDLNNPESISGGSSSETELTSSKSSTFTASKERTNEEREIFDLLQQRFSALTDERVQGVGMSDPNSATPPFAKDNDSGVEKKHALVADCVLQNEVKCALEDSLNMVDKILHSAINHSPVAIVKQDSITGVFPGSSPDSATDEPVHATTFMIRECCDIPNDNNDMDKSSKNEIINDEDRLEDTFNLNQDNTSVKKSKLREQLEEKIRQEVTAELEEKWKKICEDTKQQALENFKAENDISSEEKTKIINQLKQIILDYDETIRKILEDREQSETELRRDVINLTKERDQYEEDLHNVENSFADLHRRYEKMRNTLDEYRRNEEILHQKSDEYHKFIEREKNRYQILKKHYEEKLMSLEFEMEKLKKSNVLEVQTLKAALRKAEITIDDLQKTVEQKNTQVNELSKICDEFLSISNQKG